MEISIPLYAAKAILSHYGRIAAYAKCPASDTRTVNALRLAKADLRKLQKLIDLAESNLRQS